MKATLKLSKNEIDFIKNIFDYKINNLETDFIFSFYKVINKFIPDKKIEVSYSDITVLLHILSIYPIENEFKLKLEDKIVNIFFNNYNEILGA